METTSDRWVTFDCYGTLVDWETGISSALSALWPDADHQRLVERYHYIEPELEVDGSVPYRRVLAETLRRLAAQEGLDLPPEKGELLGESLPTWPVFEEAPGVLARLREDGWKLGILSNSDPDLLDASIATIGVPFEVTVTARDAGSYKPRFGHWEAFFEKSAADRDRYVHVGASALGDIWPVGELGLRSVWINRLAETSDLRRDAELPNLLELPPVLGRLVPAAGTAT